MLRTRLNSLTVTRVVSVVAALALIAFFVARIVFSPALPTPIGQNCGTIKQPSATPVSAAPANCLWNAFLRCQTATLTYDQNELDVGQNHVIIVQRGSNGCTVTDTVDAWSANFGGSHNIRSYTCEGIVPPLNGVFTIYGCGDEGNVTIAVSIS